MTPSRPGETAARNLNLVSEKLYGFRTHQGGGSDGFGRGEGRNGNDGGGRGGRVGSDDCDDCGLQLTMHQLRSEPLRIVAVELNHAT